MGALHQPTDDSRKHVEAMSAAGVPQAVIASVLDVTEKTLRKHYRTELDHSTAKANAAVAGALYRKATSNTHPQAVTAAIFWLKTRAGFKETTVHEVYGKDGGPIETAAAPAYDLSNFSTAELLQWQELMSKAKPKAPAPDDSSADAD